MTTLSVTSPTARKVHRCNGCGLSVRPGEVYVREAYVDGAMVYTWVLHVECARQRDELDDDESPDGFLDGSWYEPEELNPEFVAWREERRAAEAAGGKR